MGNSAFIAFVMLFILLLAFSASASALSVSLRPGYLNAARFESVMAVAHIEGASPGKYTVSVTGVPGDWLDYQKTVEGDSEKDVSPKTAGRYEISVFVSGPGGKADADCRLWVGYPGSVDERAFEEEGENSLSGGATGMFTFSEQDTLLALYAFIAAVAVIAVLAGHFILREEDEDV